MGRISNHLRTSRVVVEKPIAGNRLFAQIVKAAKWEPKDGQARLNHSGAQSEIEVGGQVDWRNAFPRYRPTDEDDRRVEEEPAETESSQTRAPPEKGHFIDTSEVVP
jgi:hypothetical protein